jgi:hypothetical protein
MHAKSVRKRAERAGSAKMHDELFILSGEQLDAIRDLFKRIKDESRMSWKQVSQLTPLSTERLRSFCYGRVTSFSPSEHRTLYNSLLRIKCEKLAPDIQLLLSRILEQGNEEYYPQVLKFIDAELLHLETKHCERTLSRYKGNYISYRRSIKKNKLVAFWLKIRASDDDIKYPTFMTLRLTDDGSRIKESGIVVPEGRKLYLLGRSSRSRNISMTVIDETDDRVARRLRGVTLGVSLNGVSFAGRIYCRRIPDGHSTSDIVRRIGVFTEQRIQEDAPELASDLDELRWACGDFLGEVVTSVDDV